MRRTPGAQPDEDSVGPAHDEETTPGRGRPLVTARVLVAGIGNIFFGDDGFGPEVARRILAHPQNLPADVTVVDYGIRGMHLAYELLDGYDALVVIDTVPSHGSVPGEITVLEVGADDLGQAEFDPHGMNPVAVLASLDSLGGTLPPTYVVGCCPADITEQIGLSPAVAAAVDSAVIQTEQIIRNLTPGSLVAAAAAGTTSKEE